MGPVWTMVDAKRAGLPTERGFAALRPRALAKRAFSFSPPAETEPIRQLVAAAFDSALPFCPPPEGELLRQLILAQNLTRCLQLGFATGSSALYMLQALATTGGSLTSIDRPSGKYNAVGKALLETASLSLGLGRHTLIEEDSAIAVPRLFSSGESFQLIFVDGWKTFDHLAAELYYLTRMLTNGGLLVFDDTAMPSVRKVIGLLRSHYAYAEIDYRQYGQGARLRVWQILISRSLQRPYRGFRKLSEEEELPVTNDWNFFRPF